MVDFPSPPDLSVVNDAMATVSDTYASMAYRYWAKLVRFGMPEMHATLMTQTFITTVYAHAMKQAEEGKNASPT